MKRPRAGSTLKQSAFARKLLNAEGGSKKEIALSVGYSKNTANKTMEKIETSEGFHNAVIKLAHESNNLILAVMSEYKARGLTNFSNKDLNGALNAIGAAWDKLNKHRAPNDSRSPENPIKKVIMQKIENQNIHVHSTTEENTNAKEEKIEKVENIDLDF